MMLEKFQLIQTAHEVLSDPIKRATYDRTRNPTGRATAANVRTSSSSTPQTPKNRYSRPTTGANGFSKTTPKTSKRAAFGYFTTREPPSSAKKPTAKSPPRTGFASTTAYQSSERERAEAYFGRFGTKTATSGGQFSSTSPQRSTTNRKVPQTKEAKKAEGVKTPKKTTQAGFGTSFEEEESEEETFYSFSSNGGSFNQTEKPEHTWSGRSSAYSHVFTGAKEDLRSPLKSNPKPTTTSKRFSSDGFQTKQHNGFAGDGFKVNGSAAGTAKQPFKATEAKPDTPPAFESGPGRRKSQQRSASSASNSATETGPSYPDEIPKTPPSVEERRFATAFSRLNVNHEQSTKPTPAKPREPINIEDWTKKFEGLNPFLSPETKKSSEDKNSWSSQPLGTSPRHGRIRVGGGKVRKGGLADMGDLKSELPKADGEPKVLSEGFGVAPTSVKFNIQIPTTAQNPTGIFPAAPPAEFVPAKPSSPTSPVGRPYPPKDVPQEPIPVATPVADRNSTVPDQPGPESHGVIPVLNPPVPPKRLIPRPSNPKEFSFSVPSMPEMQLLAQEVHAYHSAYVTERSRFDQAWTEYEAYLSVFTSEQKVRAYLEVKDRISGQRAEMDAIHTLCLERWGSVAKFSGFTG